MFNRCLEALDDSNLTVRLGAIRAMSEEYEIPPKIMTVVREYLLDAGAQADVMRELSAAPRLPPLVDPLTEYLRLADDPSPAIRAAAINSLSRLRRRNTRDVIFAHTTDKDEMVRDTALAEAMSLSPSLDILIAAASCGAANVRRQAINQLSQRGPEDARVVGAMLSTLATANPDAAGFFLKEGTDFRKYIPELIHAASNSDAYTAAIALETLGLQGSAAVNATDAIVKVLDHPDARVRQSAAQALGRIRPIDEVAVPPNLLDAIMHPKDPRNLAAKIDAIAIFGSRAKPALPSLLILHKDAPLALRRSIANALARIAPESDEAATVLLEAVKSNDHLSRTILTSRMRAAHAKADKIIPALREFVHGPDGPVRDQAQNALLELGIPRPW